MDINLQNIKVGDLLRVPLKYISFKDNIRLQVETEKSSLAPLMSDIRQNGLLQSVGIALDKKNNKIILVHGHRRFEACKKLGYKKIDARVVGIDLSEEEFSSLNLSENFHREDNSIMEMGRVFKKYKDVFDMSVSEISARNSLPKKTVETALNLFEQVPEKYMKDVIFSKPGKIKPGKISSGAATVIVSRRGFTTKEKEDLFKETRKNELPSYKVELIAKLKDNGLDLKEAIKKSDEYVMKSCDLPLSKKGLKKIESDPRFAGWTDYVRQVLTGKVVPQTDIFD